MSRDILSDVGSVDLVQFIISCSSCSHIGPNLNRVHWVTGSQIRRDWFVSRRHRLLLELSHLAPTFLLSLTERFLLPGWGGGCAGAGAP